MTAEAARSELKSLASPTAARSAARFFKTGPGQYGEGDTFIGVNVPTLRTVARQFRALPPDEIEALLNSPVHDERHLALMLLVLQVVRCDDAWRKATFDFYLRNTRFVNNWDLVDCSAPQVFGGFLLEKPKKRLFKLAQSTSLWERRIAVVSTQHFNLDTGQSATVDAPLAMALVAEAAAATTPHARHVLDVGCGAGNYTLRLLEELPNLDATLIDLSRPMLDRATERVGRATSGRITATQGDIREVELPEGQFDIVLAAAVLHHLRTDDEWRRVFTAFHRALRPGGSVWVFDLVESSIPAVEKLMRHRYGEYLTRLRDEAYRDHVFAYVEKEDTPRPLVYQLDLLRHVGFAQVEVLHKTVCFAAFGAAKG